MPHVNIVDKARIIANAENGQSIRRIALQFNINKNTVFKILKKWRDEGNINRNPGSGRRRTSTPEQDLALVNVLRANPFSTVIQAVEDINFPGSTRTGRRRVKEFELRCHAAAQKPKLNLGHKENRLGFALQHMGQNENFWNTVIFSDEKTFQSGYNGKIRVYRPKNTRFDEQYVSEKNKSGRFSVNMWAWISAQGPGVLWHIEERLNSIEYIRILENIMAPSVSQLFPEGYIFQQDNCSIHRSHLVTEWFDANNIHVLNWPSCSPDLNPMENVWGLLTRNIQRRNVRAQNMQELLEIINNAWDDISDEYCLSLFHSMPRRIADVINRNGGMTKY